MKVLEVLKKLTPLELILAAVYVLYIVLPINAPDTVANMIDSPIGMMGVFIVSIYLFFYSSPILAVLYIIVAYELLRRCCKQPTATAIQKHTPSQANKDVAMKQMNPIKKDTLEEEVVDKMAPVGKSQMADYVVSGFSPIAENINGASMV